MGNLTTVEIKAFVPSTDFDLSKRFYSDLGFIVAWSSDDLACLHAGTSSFLLQRFYRKDHADNFMMHLLVEDVEAWWRHVAAQRLAEIYAVRVTRRKTGRGGAGLHDRRPDRFSGASGRPSGPSRRPDGTTGCRRSAA